MVIVVAIEVGLVRGEAMDQYIVGRLDMKGLLDLGVGRDEEMDEDQSRQQKRKDREDLTGLARACENKLGSGPTTMSHGGRR